MAKLRVVNASDASEQKATKGQELDYLDSFISQTIGKEPFLSFSRANDTPVQWIQLLHALDQHGNKRTAKGSTIENREGARHHIDVSLLTSEMNGKKEAINYVKQNSDITKMTNIAEGGMQSLKIPEAVAAFAQAAAKANGEREKYLPGWPLLSSSKVPLQKCEKCSREFCSTVNYKRHIRVHRRYLNIDKVSPRSRELLGSFWDKLSMDEEKEILSFNHGASLEVDGSSVIRALTSLIQRPGLASLPQTYLKAGATLLDIVQANSSRFPISSQELFSVLEDASEKTFLCTGTAASLQKFIFDDEVGKVAQDVKNVIACTSFLIEQKLVKAWLADKDAEALRCQKLLMEEEEASQKRQAELLERKRLKKMKQKDQKAKEYYDENNADLKLKGSNMVEDTSCPSESPSPRHFIENDLDTSEASFESPKISDIEDGMSCSIELAMTAEHLASIKLSSSLVESVVECDELEDGATESCICCQNQYGGSQTETVITQSTVPKLDLVSSTNFAATKRPNSKAAPLVTGQMIWTRKTKPGMELVQDSSDKVKETRGITDLTYNSNVLIGSINVPLANCNRDYFKQENSPERQAKDYPNNTGACRPSMKFWMPVSRYGNGDLSTLRSCKDRTECGSFADEAVNAIPPEKNSLIHEEMGNIHSGAIKVSKAVFGSAHFSVPQLFSCQVAESFLARRWKDALATDHVKIVPSLAAESRDCIDRPEDNCMEKQLPSSDDRGRSILGSAENRMDRAGPISSGSNFYKPSLRAKSGKNHRVKYIPKQRNDVSDI